MAITIRVGSEANRRLVKLELDIRKSLSGDLMIFEHGDMDIVLSPTKNKVIAFDSGYVKSKTTILDANITTLIAAIILFIMGSGPVKGFSVTLGIGILTTLFSVYFIARLLTAFYVINNKDKEKLI